MNGRACLLIAAVFAGPTAHAIAQTYPTGPIRMIVPAAPGGSADILARLIGGKLQERLGQPVVADNRPGAGQMIGGEVVAKAPPDGHTLVLFTVTYTTGAAIRSKMAFDPLNDLTGVTMIGRGPLLLTVHPSLPVKSVKELVAFAKAKPGQLNYGSSGSGSIIHFATEVFAASAGINLVHVPYKSIAPAVTDAVGGHIPLLIVSMPSGWPQVKANRLRALAVTTGERSAFVPELPTMAEAGVPGYDVSTWWGIYTRARTPAEIVNRLNREIQQILMADDVKSRFAAEGADPLLGMTPDAFNAYTKAEIAKWSKIAKARNIRID
jgi:tripartite-type tricarboxylate transporter receptor subunit TctC